MYKYFLAILTNNFVDDSLVSEHCRVVGEVLILNQPGLLVFTVHELQLDN